MRRPLLFLALILAVSLGVARAAGEETEVASFDKRAADLSWQTVNDNVMGGRSRGGSAAVEGRLVFAGSTNTNGGGFSSIRAAVSGAALKGDKGLELRVKGDGRTYTLMARTDARYRRSAIWYRASFPTTPDRWSTVRVPFTELRAQWRGMAVRASAFDPRRLSGLGFMIYDKQDGAFRLEIDRIRAYGAPKPLPLTPFKGKKRPLVVFAPSASDERLVEQLGQLTGSQEAFEERDMLLVVVLAKGTSTIDGSPLAAKEAAALRKQYAIGVDAFAVHLIGKDGGVKRKAGEPVSLAGLYVLIDTMPVRRSEIADRDE